jgi:hypothetical protein
MTDEGVVVSSDPKLCLGHLPADILLRPQSSSFVIPAAIVNALSLYEKSMLLVNLLEELIELRTQHTDETWDDADASARCHGILANISRSRLADLNADADWSFTVNRDRGGALGAGKKYVS